MPRYVRVYRCPDCNHKWKTESHLGFLEPDCPSCGFHPDPVPQRVCMPAIVGTKSKAVDFAQQVAEEDFGLTNMRDNAKEGETAFIPPTMPNMPPAPPANIVAPNNSVANAGGFMWGGGGAKQAQPAQVPVKQVLANASATSRASDAERGLRMLHRQRPVLNAHSLGRFNRR